MTHERSIWARRSLAATRIGRLRALAIVVALGYSAVLLRAVQVHVWDVPLLDRLLRERQRETAALPLRGDIVDRDGRLLAASADVQSLGAVPRKIADANVTAQRIAGALGTPADRIERSLARGGHFVWVRRWLDEAQAKQIEGLDDEGLTLVRERRRHYPNGELAGAYLGFAGYDEQGVTGLEKAFDAQLQGKPTELASVVPVPVASQPARGATLRLALDAPLQAAAEQALADGIRDSGAKRGSLLALDPFTGDVLVAAEAPGFDPNRFRDADRELFAVQSFVRAFEPGSTLKPFTIAAALESGVLSPGEVFDCENGSWRVATRVIHDHHPYKLLDVRGILRVSSNIGVAKIAERIGSERLVHWFREFGFGRAVEVAFPYASAGLLRDIREKQSVERANLAFGHGLTASTLQVALAAAVLANGGRRVDPRIAIAIERAEGREPFPGGPGERVLSEATARRVMDMLESVVSDGTGTGAALPTHSVAGKTGTAQKLEPNGTYSRERFTASFFGILPARQPRLVVVIVLDEPARPRHTGGIAAAPVFRTFAEYAVQRLAIPQDLQAPVSPQGRADKPVDTDEGVAQ